MENADMLEIVLIKIKDLVHKKDLDKIEAFFQQQDISVPKILEAFKEDSVVKGKVVKAKMVTQLCQFQKYLHSAAENMHLVVDQGIVQQYTVESEDL
jgi:hypothetical protein